MLILFYQLVNVPFAILSLWYVFGHTFLTLLFFNKQAQGFEPMTSRFWVFCLCYIMIIHLLRSIHIVIFWFFCFVRNIFIVIERSRANTCIINKFLLLFYEILFCFVLFCLFLLWNYVCVLRFGDTLMYWNFLFSNYWKDSFIFFL